MVECIYQYLNCYWCSINQCTHGRMYLSIPEPVSVFNQQPKQCDAWLHAKSFIVYRCTDKKSTTGILVRSACSQSFLCMQRVLLYTDAQITPILFITMLTHCNINLLMCSGSEIYTLSFITAHIYCADIAADSQQCCLLLYREHQLGSR